MNITSPDAVGGFAGALLFTGGTSPSTASSCCLREISTIALEHTERGFHSRTDVFRFVKPSVLFCEPVKFRLCATMPYMTQHSSLLLLRCWRSVLRQAIRKYSSVPRSSRPCAPSARRTSDYWVCRRVCGGRVDPCCWVGLRAGRCANTDRSLLKRACCAIFHDNNLLLDAHVYLWGTHCGSFCSAVLCWYTVVQQQYP